MEPRAIGHTLGRLAVLVERELLRRMMAHVSLEMKPVQNPWQKRAGLPQRLREPSDYIVLWKHGYELSQFYFRVASPAANVGL